MTDQQWQCAWEIYRAARELPDERQRSYVVSASADPEVFEQVILLLQEPAVLVPLAPDLKAGERISRYEIVGKLGRGGMGQVYAARDAELGRLVALKFVDVEVVATRPLMDRLIREAKAASALNHPHIVTVYEVVHSAGEVALAMELVEGEALRTYCGKAQPITQVLRWGRQAAQALAAAHGRNIVHRDIKPENLMVRTDGYIKVLDFGLARHITPTGQADSSTGSGMLRGTLNYMSPEQARGEAATSASDVFSLGLVLYELITGVHPFLSDSPLDTAHAIAHSRPKPPSALNHKISPSLDSLLLAMLAKASRDRPSAAEVDQKLAELEAGTEGKGPRGLPRFAVSTLAACLVCIFVFWLFWGRTTQPRKPVMTQLTTQVSENRVTAAAVSPDGKTLAFAALGQSIYLRRMSDGFTQPLNTPSGLNVSRIAWFANDSSLLVSGTIGNRPSGVWVMPVRGGTPKMVIPDSKDAVPSPDGTRIAMTNLDGSEIWTAADSGGSAREVRDGGSTTSFSALIWSPDSKRIAYQRQGYAPQKDRLTGQRVKPIEKNYVYSYESIDVETGQVVASAKDVVLSSACGLPDGRVLFLRWVSPEQILKDQIWELRTDPHTGILRGPPRQLSHVDVSGLSSISASNDSRQIVVVLTTEHPNVYIADLPPAGTIPRLLDMRRLTFAEAAEFPHAWTRDNQAVLFESNRTGHYQIYRQNVGQSEAEPLVASSGDEVLPHISPDGKWVLYDRWDRRNGNRILMRVGVGGGTPKRVPTHGQLAGFRCALQAGAG
ncbi:MAG: protein kinase domain-containing protein, partial [Terriglobia bacterium]